MGALDNLATWTFGTLSYARVVEGSPWDTEPAPDEILKDDPILEGGHFLDAGGWTHAEYTHLAAFESAAERDAAAALWGTTATHTNVQGIAWGARLRGTQKLVGPGGLYYLRMTFRRV